MRPPRREGCSATRRRVERACAARSGRRGPAVTSRQRHRSSRMAPCSWGRAMGRSTPMRPGACPTRVRVPRCGRPHCREASARAGTRGSARRGRWGRLRRIHGRDPLFVPGLVHLALPSVAAGASAERSEQPAPRRRRHPLRDLRPRSLRVPHALLGRRSALRSGLGREGTGTVLSPPVVGDGQVYVGSTDGTVSVFPVACGRSGQTCRPAWSIPDLGLLPNPSLVDGVLFVGSTWAEKELLAFDADCGASGANCVPLWTFVVTDFGAFQQPTASDGNGTLFAGTGDRPGRAHRSVADSTRSALDQTRHRARARPLMRVVGAAQGRRDGRDAGRHRCAPDGARRRRRSRASTSRESARTAPERRGSNIQEVLRCLSASAKVRLAA